MQVERPKPYYESGPRIDRRKLIGMALGALLVGLYSIPAMQPVVAWALAGFMLLLQAAWLLLVILERGALGRVVRLLVGGSVGID
jgi:hypothetical protein